MDLKDFIDKNRVNLPKHILGFGNDYSDLGNLNNDQINYILGLSNELKKSYDWEVNEYFSHDLNGKKLFLHFTQPSTRTRMSTIEAASDLGVFRQIIGPHESSEEKGESLRDTIQMYEANGADILVIRGDYDLRNQIMNYGESHDQSDRLMKYYMRDDLGPYNTKRLLTKGDLEEFNLRIICAGDFNNHPTQALLDLSTLMRIAEMKGKDIKRIEDLDLNVVFMGSTDGYRAAQSLGEALNHTKCNVANVLPHGGKAMDKLWGLKSENATELMYYPYPHETDSEKVLRDIRSKDSIMWEDNWKQYLESRSEYPRQLKNAIQDADVLYFTRWTGNRPATEFYILDKKFVDENAPSAYMMHPLPRGNDPHISLDRTWRDTYSKIQPQEGFHVRHALILAMLIEENLNESYSIDRLSDPMLAWS